MKKITVYVLLLVLLCSVFVCFTGCGEDRENVLRICNAGEYMSEETYMGFVDWYYEKTGKTVEIEYTEFDTLENLYTLVARKKEDYDLVCPSDYMVQRFISDGLLLPLNEDTKTIVYDAVDPVLIQMMKKTYDSEGVYSMPYLWGTFGIMYNTMSNGQKGIQADEKAKYDTWECFWDPANTNKIYMKDSVRDAYSMAKLYEQRNALRVASNNFTDYSTAAYQQVLSDVFSKTDINQINAIKKLLREQKKYVYDYEVDSAKDEMLQDVDGKNQRFGFFWSCDAGYIINGEEGNCNKNLCYVVPKEGGNLWIDNFVIPKYAKNTEAANYFIQYLCDPEVAFDCIDYVGCTSAVKEADEMYAEMLEEDEDGFFEGTYEGFKEMYLDMLFPSDETLTRCSVMIDFGDYNMDLDEMWVDVTM